MFGIVRIIFGITIIEQDTLPKIICDLCVMCESMRHDASRDVNYIKKGLVVSMIDIYKKQYHIQ